MCRYSNLSQCCEYTAAPKRDAECVRCRSHGPAVLLLLLLLLMWKLLGLTIALWLRHVVLCCCVVGRVLEVPGAPGCMRSVCGARLDVVASSGRSRAELVLDYRFTRSLADRPSPRPIAPFIPAPETAVGLWLVISSGWGTFPRPTRADSRPATPHQRRDTQGGGGQQARTESPLDLCQSFCRDPLCHED